MHARIDEQTHAHMQAGTRYYVTSHGATAHAHKLLRYMRAFTFMNVHARHTRTNAYTHACTHGGKHAHVHAYTVHV